MVFWPSSPGRHGSGSGIGFYCRSVQNSLNILVNFPVEFRYNRYVTTTKEKNNG